MQRSAGAAGPVDELRIPDSGLLGQPQRRLGRGVHDVDADEADAIAILTVGLREQDAYRRIQQQSMNLRRTMREVAEAIIIASEV